MLLTGNQAGETTEKVAEEVVNVTNQATEEVNQLIQYFN